MRHRVAVDPDGTFSIIASFHGGADGAFPATNLVAIGSTLYGTTEAGGNSNCGGSGCGTVFAVTPAGAEAPIYAFEGALDGSAPSQLIASGDTLYGTAVSLVGPSNGGRQYCGTVFAVTLGGSETTLHIFDKVEQGCWPNGRLLQVGSALYGTTQFGGASAVAGKLLGAGTVFRIDLHDYPARVGYKVVHSFSGPDGQSPRTGLIEAHGLLYGTTDSGGQYGSGTVFSITPQGAEAVVYAFQGNLDGSEPNGVIDVGGLLYGSALIGACGNFRHCGYGAGTLFSIRP